MLESVVAHRAFAVGMLRREGGSAVGMLRREGGSTVGMFRREGGSAVGMLRREGGSTVGMLRREREPTLRSSTSSATTLRGGMRAATGRRGRQTRTATAAAARPTRTLRPPRNARAHFEEGTPGRGAHSKTLGPTRGHNYMGHNCMGHSYMDHNDIGHNGTLGNDRGNGSDGVRTRSDVHAADLIVGVAVGEAGGVRQQVAEDDLTSRRLGRAVAIKNLKTKMFGGLVNRPGRFSTAPAP